MGWIRRVVENWARSIGGAPISQTVPSWLTAFPIGSKESIRSLLENGYRREALIFSCIQEIASSAAEPELKAGYLLANGEVEEDPNHPLRDLFRNPNPETSSYGLVNRLLIDLEATGGYFLQKVKNRAGATVQLWNVRPDRIRFNVETTGRISSFQYSFDGMNPQLIPAEEMIYDKFPDPLDDFWGLSPITALARFGDLDRQTADFMRSYFHNAGSPAGILKFKAKVQKEERERVKQLWQQQYTGIHGANGMAVLDADADYQSLGGQAERLRLNFIFDATETRICMCFGVPPILVGAAIGLNRSTFANYKEARQSFWDETLSPLYKQISQALSRGFIDEYGPDLVVWFDTERVSALQEDHEQKRRYGLDAWNAQLITRNEAREMAGLPEAKNDLAGDEFKADPATAAPGLAGDPLAGMLGDGPKNGAMAGLLGFAREAKGEREDFARTLAEIRQAVHAVLEAPAPAREDLHLHVTTDAGEGMERMAEGMGHLAHALLDQKPPEIKVEVAAPHVEVHAAPSQAKRIDVRRGADGKLESATVTPDAGA